MKEQLKSAHVDSDGDVIASTKRACYKFKHKLKEPEKLLAKLAKAQEIDTQHWQEVWVYEGVDISQDKTKK